MAADVDLEELDDGWVLQVRLPGVAPEEVTVDVGDRELVVRTIEEPPARSRVVYRMTVPAGADPDGVDATMDHGLLVVRLPRMGAHRSGAGRWVEWTPADARHEPVAESYDAAAGTTYQAASYRQWNPEPDDDDPADDSVLGPAPDSVVAPPDEPVPVTSPEEVVVTPAAVVAAAPVPEPPRPAADPHDPLVAAREPA